MPPGLSETFIGNVLAVSSSDGPFGKEGSESGGGGVDMGTNRATGSPSRLELLAWVPACVAWRAVSGCDPIAATRRPSRDRPCDVVVPHNHAGFCECGGGRAIVTFTCAHQPLTCQKVRIGQGSRGRGASLCRLSMALRVA